MERPQTCESSARFCLLLLLRPVCEVGAGDGESRVKVTVDQLSTLTGAELRFSSAAGRPTSWSRPLAAASIRRREGEIEGKEGLSLLTYYTAERPPEDRVLLFSAQQDRLEQTETVKVGQSASCVRVCIPPSSPPPTGYPPPSSSCPPPPSYISTLAFAPSSGFSVPWTAIETTSLSQPKRQQNKEPIRPNSPTAQITNTISVAVICF